MHETQLVTRNGSDNIYFILFAGVSDHFNNALRLGNGEHNQEIHQQNNMFLELVTRES